MCTRWELHAVTVSGDHTGAMCALQLMQPCALYGSCVPHLGATCAIRKPCGIKWETDGAFKSHMHRMELPAPYGCPVRHMEGG
jgi:hypothetical protein